MSEIKKAFKALSNEQRALIDDRKVAGSRPVDQWIELLDGVSRFEAEAAGVAQGGGGFFARRFARKHDLPAAFGQFALPLLPILREDQDPQSPLALSLDFTGAEQKPKQLRASEPYKKGVYRKVIDTFYDDPWIQVEAKFADGTQLSFAVIDHLRSQRKTKKTASGKIKTKTKRKKKTEVTVTLSFPAKNYAAAAKPVGVGATVRKSSVKPQEDRTIVRLSNVLGPPTIDWSPEPDHLLALVAEAYGRVDPARRKKL